MIRTLRSGKVVEKSLFYVGERRPRRARKRGNSSASKKDSNMNQASRRLARILNCNCTSGMLFLTLTYDPEHYAAIDKGGYKAAEKLCSLFLRRLTRIAGSMGVKFKYTVWITADKDEKTSLPVRIHHHLIISAEGFDLTWSGKKLESIRMAGKDLSEIWGQGFINVQVLKKQDDYSPLAIYLVRQAVDLPDAKKWHSARGLVQPVVESEKVVVIPHELRAPGGADVKEIGHYDAETGTHYLRYVRKPSPRTDLGPVNIDMCFEEDRGADGI